MGTWTRRRLLLSTATGAAGLAGTAPAHAAGRGRRGDDRLLGALRALPGLRVVEERPGAEPGYRFFVLGLRQPVDHTDRAAGTFEQRLTLLHTATDRPTVLFTTGYEAVLTARRTEPTIVLGGNQLQVEHRYFGASRPPTADYAHLTIRQAAEDHHRVVRLFRTMYPGAWISTGGSKGGMASVYHRRFHPRDVDGTVASSAPNNVDDREDSAYLRFLARVGTAETRAALERAQREALVRRAELVARYETWAASTGDTFRIVGSADKALEIAVLRAPFMFWQNGGATDPSTIPAPGAPTGALYAWLNDTALLPAYADTVARPHIPYFYQLGTELGYWDAPTHHLADLRRYPDAMQPRSFVPRDVPLRFDATVMPDIDRWVRRHGDRMLFLNGAQDPAVAEPFHPGGRDSRTLWAPNASHHVTFDDLSAADRADAIATLNRWAYPAQGS
ncbi:S28 family serine protease [Streptomyces botrytidirepellens]|uniref:Aminopeptidase n=1 Tax=Streptomyces botrytidirepellens TaxID=2486417 RepID=A0A3M8SZP4_9ACTN|nr:S28 family serine protease [Streptomyces botrytidirepellens]RNF84734.1 aminopeptidase [Streptomyces botrytidirepellens]